jgi:hypothetical protein
MKKWSQDGNLLEEGAKMLAVYPSIKPENQSFVKEKGIMDTEWKKEILAVYQSIKPKNQSFIKEK